MVPQSPPQTADVEQPAAELPVHAPETEGLSQVTSVSQLSDVRPTDWAFQALQSLVERYGCIVGYPDKTYRGDRALTRYEFAAGLNACLDKIQELIAAATTDFVKREDLEIIKKLQEEFTAELASLRGRLDGLEVRTATLEKQQFSTTTKLVGEAIFAISDLFGDQVDDLNNTVFQDRVRIDLQTSFTGRDILHTRLAAGNVEQFLIRGSTLSAFVVNSAGQQQGTAEGTLTPRINGQTDNRVVLDRLDYTLPVGDRLKLYVAATGGKSQHYVHSTVNPYFEDFDGGKGSISAFSQESPIYRIGGGAGAALEVSVNDRKTVTLTAGYLATHADNPGAGQGLLNGDYAALGQLTITPSDAFQIGLTYVHAYHTAGNSIFSLGLGDNNFFTGTLPANAIHTAFGLSAVTNSYGVEASLKLAPSLVLNAFGGYTDLKLLGSGNGEIWYYGLGLALPDLFKQGNLGGVMVGVEPYLGRVNAAGFGLRDLGLRDLGLRNDTSLHIEGFYKFQVTDNISITPGVIWVTAPDQDNANSDYVVGTIRTTFSF
ncbi:MAG: iron uptake porin [Leptolyngbyaceae cyanobacterium RU_5_1]|nr:iron uptake porin [Leptolyngbyaceae cyanobacterium RU_5_1]